MELTERKKRILASVVDKYIETAEPVGSKYLANEAGLGCSSATIRNELAELVNMGYLEQPHTSAGRVPTPQGYRMYVNELMEKQRMSIEETEDLNARLSAKLDELDNTIDSISKLASQLTNYPALALTSAARSTIKRYDFIYVDANTIILVAMLSNNSVKNKLVHLPVSVDENLVMRLSSMFNASFTGISDEEITPQLINTTERASGDSIGLTSVIAAFAIESMSSDSATSAYIAGENRLLNHPEFRDPDKAHRLMNYLQSGGYILPPDATIEDTSEVRVLIGPENVAEELKDSSVIVTSYDAGDGTRGLIGIVGPTRMDYSIIAEKLSFLANGLSKRLGAGTSPVTGMHNKLIIKGDDSDR